ncbi:MAG: hypothetical protein JEY94_02905 [Melioribacteraceae bacterium]|nr:hypothetical protein [Melioribacteraceae bacterium]
MKDNFNNSDGKIEVEHFSINKKILTKKGSDFQFMVPWSIENNAIETIDKKKELLDLYSEQRMIKNRLDEIQTRIFNLQDEIAHSD